MLRSWVLMVLLWGQVFCVSAQGVSPDTRGRDFDLRSSDPAAISRALCTPLSNDYDRARAIFSWLAHHIEYDLVEAQSNRPVQIMYHSQEDLDRQLANIRRRRMQKALQTRKGVCNHYASLYQTMCQAVGIEAGEIEGYVARFPGEAGRLPNESNHVWNWVEVNGSTLLLDVTYAAGMADMTGMRFEMNYEPTWFDVPPEIMIQTHFPDQQNNQLLPQPLSPIAFAQMPFFYPSSVRMGLLQWSPTPGILPRTKEELNLEFLFSVKPKGVYVIVDDIAQELKTVWTQNSVRLEVPSDLIQNLPMLQIGVEETDGTLSYLMAWRLKKD